MNNAGVGFLGSFAALDTEKQMSMLRLNVDALTHLTRLLLPAMIKRGNGRILNVASTAAFQPGPLMASPR
ncbi:MAG: SDR family NAD(P)-dependent oxidoreductase [Acidobacteriota bacterium]